MGRENEKKIRGSDGERVGAADSGASRIVAVTHDHVLFILRVCLANEFK